VDNCVTSVETKEEMNEFRAVATSVMSSGGFDLRGWECSGECDPFTDTSVLGLTWNKREDVLMLSRVASWKIPEIITQREILSFAQKIYDPLGFVCPVTLHPKLLLRKLQEENLGWDTEVDDDAKETFLQWSQELQKLNQVKIPRWLSSTNRSAISSIRRCKSRGIRCGDIL